MEEPRPPRAKVEIITPEVATDWLEKNETNRRLDQARVALYARDMKAGSWLLTGEPLMFGASGRLLNGQHRLWACIEADTAFETFVIRGLHDEAAVMDVLDTGKKRTLGDALSIHGETDAILLAAILNLAYRYDHGTLVGRQVFPTHAEALDYLRENPDLRATPQIARRAYQETKLGASAIGAAYFLTGRTDAYASEQFWTLIASGEGLTAGDPILAYRRWAVGMLAKREKPSNMVVLRYALKAMNYWRAGKKIRVLVVKSDEDIPPLWKT